jgi:hypothetical protein
MKVYPGRPDMVGPVGPPVRHDPLNGNRVVSRFRLRPGGLARHDPFLFRAVPGPAPEGTSLARLEPCMARWPGIAKTEALNPHRPCQTPSLNRPTSTIYCYKKGHLNICHSPHHSIVSLFYVLSS